MSESATMSTVLNNVFLFIIPSSVTKLYVTLPSMRGVQCNKIINNMNETNNELKDSAKVNGNGNSGNEPGNGNQGNNGNTHPGNGNNGNGNNGGSQDKKISITVIVSGTATIVEVNSNQKIKVIANKALEQTGNTARPLSDWTVKTKEGSVLNLDSTVKDNHLVDGAVVVMSLSAGVGGNKQFN